MMRIMRLRGLEDERKMNISTRMINDETSWRQQVYHRSTTGYTGRGGVSWYDGMMV